MASSYFENPKQSESKSVITLEKLKEFESSNKQKKSKFIGSVLNFLANYLNNSQDEMGYSQSSSTFMN